MDERGGIPAPAQRDSSGAAIGLASECQNSHVPVRIAGNYKPSLVIPPCVFIVFVVKKERRRHLHHMIDRHRLDMTHVTERVGSPQTLVCTKDRRTFDRRMKQYQDEIAAMRTLVRLAPKAGGAALSKRMEVAVKRAADLKQRQRRRRSEVSRIFRRDEQVCRG